MRKDIKYLFIPLVFAAVIACKCVYIAVVVDKTIERASLQEQQPQPLQQRVKQLEQFCETPFVCDHVFVIRSKKVTFCSAAKVASTTTRMYFYKLANGSDRLVIPPNAKYGVLEANWTRLSQVDTDLRLAILLSSEWRRVFFVRHVLERFVSGYLDKVVHDCGRKHQEDPRNLAIGYYYQYGFSCENHTDLEAFVSFMETVPSMESHFRSQTNHCWPNNINHHSGGAGSSNTIQSPYTDIILVNETLSTRLEELSVELGVQHPSEERDKTSSHSTFASEKIRHLFQGKSGLVRRILNLFEEDCKMFPQLCHVESYLLDDEVS